MKKFNKKHTPQDILPVRGVDNSARFHPDVSLIRILLSFYKSGTLKPYAKNLSASLSARFSL